MESRDNARTALRILKLFNAQEINPRITRINKDSFELQFYNPVMEQNGYRVLVSQVYDFAKRVLNQYTAVSNSNSECKSCAGSRYDTIAFDDIKI